MSSDHDFSDDDDDEILALVTQHQQRNSAVAAQTSTTATSTTPISKSVPLRSRTTTPISHQNLPIPRHANDDALSSTLQSARHDLESAARHAANHTNELQSSAKRNDNALSSSSYANGDVQYPGRNTNDGSQANESRHRATEVNSSQANDLQSRLYRADGEVAILRAKLSALQNQSRDEMAKLKASMDHQKLSNDEQINALKYTVEKLEDEKKFLHNEIKSASSGLKRRKLLMSTKDGAEEDQMDLDVPSQPPARMLQPRSSRTQQQAQNGDTHGSSEYSVADSSLSSSSATLPSSAPPPPVSAPAPRVIQKIVKVQSDSFLFADHIWNYCINGSQRTSLAILGKICLPEDVIVEYDFKIKRQMPISETIVEFLISKRDSRLDDLLYDFSTRLCKLIALLLSPQQKNILPVPFILSLIHAGITFKKSAVNEKTIEFLTSQIISVMRDYIFLLDSSQDEEDFINYHDTSYQKLILENLVLVNCGDILEKLVCIAASETTASMALANTKSLMKRIWHRDYFSYELFSKILPENAERFKSAAQINLVCNMVEMLMASVTEDTFAFNDDRLNDLIISSLTKVFLMDVPIKEGFMFYGLNRVLGNNSDLHNIELIIPSHENILGQSIISIPCPITKPNFSNHEMFEIDSKHEHHLLNLRIRIVRLLEVLITTQSSIERLSHKEYMKSMIRTIGFEQNYVMRSPRSKYVALRIEIISHLIRIIFYIINDLRNINNLIYPETLYELFVVLMRIAFGSNPLSTQAAKLLHQVRTRGILDKGVFNQWCEFRSREINHLNYPQQQYQASAKTQLAEYSLVESDFPNGLEFPYEAETVELAREILSICANHEEADNLYYNMNGEDPKSMGSMHDSDNGQMNHQTDDNVNNEMRLYDL